MKKYIKKALLLAFIAIGLSSCSTDKVDAVASNNGNFVLKSPTDGSFVLSATTAGDVAFTATWAAADFGYKAATSYKLQMVKASNSFSDDQTQNPSFDLGNFTSAPGGAELQKTLKGREFNSLVLAAGGSAGTAENFKIRIYANVNDQTTSTYHLLSQEATISATPYDAFDEFARIYVPGNYGGNSTFADWDPTNAPKLFSKAGDDKYEGFVWMNNPAPEFKFTYDTTWNNDKGDTTENPNSFTTLVHSGGKNIKPGGAGTYFMTVDWNANTYSVGARQIGIIGAAVPGTGWGSAQYLTFDTNPVSPYYRMYTIDIALNADEFLIRTKDDWSEKMGSLQTATETLQATSANKIKFGGQNMKVPAAGNYKVVLDVRNAANYNLRLIPN